MYFFFFLIFDKIVKVLQCEEENKFYLGIDFGGLLLQYNLFDIFILIDTEVVIRNGKSIKNKNLKYMVLDQGLVVGGNEIVMRGWKGGDLCYEIVKFQLYDNLEGR